MNFRNHMISEGGSGANETLQTLPTPIERVGMSTTKDDKKQLCILLQNSETLTNPNYSHFFVILNSNVPQQLNSLQNAPTTYKDNNLNVSPLKVLNSTSFRANCSSEQQGQHSLNIREDRVLKDDFPDSSITQGKGTASNTNPLLNYNKNQFESDEEFEKNKYLAGFRNNYILNLNSHKQRKDNKHLSIPNDSGIKCEMPLSSEFLNGENLSNVICHLNAPTANKLKIEVTPNLPTQSKHKPIKRISLGKHKNAIQQINTPLKMDDLNKGCTRVKEVSRNSKRHDLKVQNVWSFKKSTTHSPTASRPMNGNNFDSLQTSKNLESVTSGCISAGSNPTEVSSTFGLSDSFICSSSVFLTNKLNARVGTVDPKIQKAASKESKTLASVQELFPVSVNGVPDCALRTYHTSSPPYFQNTMILQSSNEKPQTPRKAVTRSTLRPKGRRKTVKELLQERQRCSDPRKSAAIRREIRVLRPLCKIPTTQQKMENHSKRPNIMILPSVSRQPSQLESRKQPFILSVSPSDNSLRSKSGEDGRGRRPRYYDLSELQVGYFKVEDDVDASGRFRSKFKVIFTKCQFLYDFPVSRCNRPELKKSEVSGQVARITIPFQTVTSMSMRDRIIYICVSDTPQITLGMITPRSGKFSNVYETDSTWREFLKSTFTHKVVLRKRQAGKLKNSLCQFDEKFISLTSTFGNSLAREERDPYVFGNEMSSHFLETAKNKKPCLRRLPQWDLKRVEGDLLTNQVCSCRTNCRHVRCSCVKAAKSCSFSGCQCINCNNPLNVLETIGMDIDFSIQDTCLFQNIYQIPELLNYLQREVRLECCKSFARVQDCIPGIVLCPNINCDTRLEFSWCHRVVCYPEYNPRNHCSFCGQCRFSAKYHCFSCKRCYAAPTKSVRCPRCEKHQVSVESKPFSKPAIVVLQSQPKEPRQTRDCCQSEAEISLNK